MPYPGLKTYILLTNSGQKRNGLPGHLHGKEEVVVMRSNVKIAQEAELYPIREIAKVAGIREDELEQYGEYIGKVNLRISAGAGFVVPITEVISLMPGLPKKPAPESIDIDEGGKITGLF